jgi:hypothetical protein
MSTTASNSTHLGLDQAAIFDNIIKRSKSKLAEEEDFAFSKPKKEKK